jgi:hypothetical protein
MLAQGMITVKEAVAKAMEFAQAMLAVPASEILVEEVETGKDGPNDVWQITLSAPGRAGIAVLRRDYKRFIVRGDTGEVVSMKIRELAGSR